MAYIRLPFGIRVALEYEQFGKVVVNVYHVEYTQAILTATLIDVADIFETWWTTSFASIFSEDIALTSITALNLDVENGEKITLVVSPPEAGGTPSGAAPNNVAIVASFATAKTGRSFRGRSYQAGLADTAITGNVITTTKAASIVSGYEALITNLALEDFDLVVASFQANNAPRAVGVATVVDSVSVNTRVDTQRRRLPTS